MAQVTQLREHSHSNKYCFLGHLTATLPPFPTLSPHEDPIPYIAKLLFKDPLGTQDTYNGNLKDFSPLW